MKNYLLFFLCCFLLSSCAEGLDIETESVEPEEIETSYYDPSLPGMVMFVTPGNSFAIGETIIGWDNHLYDDGGVARPDGDGSSAVPTSPRGESEIYVEPHLGLYQFGQFVRELGPDEVNIYFDRVPGIDNSTKNFEWKIPSWQALGDGYTLKFWETIRGIPWCCHTGDESIEFSIVAASKIEIIEPAPWVTNYTEGAPLNYGVRFYCNSPSISATVSIYKGNTLKGIQVFSNVPVYQSFAYVQSAFLLSTANYPPGNDYRFVVEMNCTGSLIYHTEYFQIMESVGGGVPPFEFLPGGW